MQPHETMQPSVWYTVQLQMVENQIGNISLAFRDYQYLKAQTNTNGTTNWRCHKKTKGCLGRVTTRGHNQLKIGLRPHNHPPFVARRKGKQQTTLSPTSKTNQRRRCRTRL
uniref:(northern house mosquito) hypothetical protein n=2 Tax=Culex pipiens TaxID=7175 RepID=A0A8D8CYE8_CULPI